MYEGTNARSRPRALMFRDADSLAIMSAYYGGRSRRA
jgi:hypothetical protein